MRSCVNYGERSGKPAPVPDAPCTCVSYSLLSVVSYEFVSSLPSILSVFLPSCRNSDLMSLTGAIVVYLGDSICFPTVSTCFPIRTSQRARKYQAVGKDEECSSQTSTCIQRNGSQRGGGRRVQKVEEVKESILWTQIATAGIVESAASRCLGF
jgi:hypothetical protein